MTRIRTIKPEFWHDEKLGPLNPIDRLVFLGLISMADDAGRLVDSVKAIDGFVFALRAESSGASLENLQSLGRIIRYVSESGQPLIQIANWDRHQKLSHKSKYVLPAPRRADDNTDPSSNTPEIFRKSSSLDLGPRTLDLGPRTGDPRGGANSEEPPSSLRDGTGNGKGNRGGAVPPDRPDSRSVATEGRPGSRRSSPSDTRAAWQVERDRAREDAVYVRSIGAKIGEAGGPAQPGGAVFPTLTPDEKAAWKRLGGAARIYEQYAQEVGR